MAGKKHSFPWHTVLVWGGIAIAVYLALQLLPSLISGIGSAVSGLTSTASSAATALTSSTPVTSTPIIVPPAANGASSSSASNVNPSGFQSVFFPVTSGNGPIPAKRWGVIFSQPQ